MDRGPSLVLWTFWLFGFYVITYYGIESTVWSSLIFSLFLSDVLLLFCYPPSNAADDDVDVGLYIYVSILIVSFVLFLIYILQKTLSDQRIKYVILTYSLL